MIRDWQLPTGVNRGLWDYLHAADMVAGYDEQLRSDPLAAADLAYCERAFPTPGRLADLGCGTGRLCAHFVARGYSCVGVDLSEVMLAHARAKLPGVTWIRANLVELDELPDAGFDYAACLYSTLGMIRGSAARARAVAHARRILRPGGRFVVHAHNRFFHGLGRRRIWVQRWKTLLGRCDAGDLVMPQPYGGGPLTLHHFTRGELLGLVRTAGFDVLDVAAIGADGRPARGSAVYGWLITAQRP